ncbi:isochorismatase family protein [Alcaligenaceae bacterium]|nr:isochorismatase family protein [Alcaligenaceae bacterium]
MKIDSANTAGGFYGSLEFGSRPALLIIDFQRGFTEAGLTPLAADCGTAIAALNRLIAAYRGKGPIFHTVVAYRNPVIEAGPFLKKCGSLVTLIDGSPPCEIDPRIDFVEGEDLVIRKTQASAFHGTHLNSLLSAHGCDTLIVTGCTTSGCVRASAVDAMQNGYAPFVVSDCVSDRSREQHESNLIDLQSKYAQVCGSEALIALLSRA